MSAQTQENSFSKKSNLGQDFQDIGKATSTLANDAMNLVHDNANQYYDQGMKQVKKAEIAIESRIKDHPVQSLLIVAGIGLVLGALWNRR